jgi:hypothetical protein
LVAFAATPITRNLNTPISSNAFCFFTYEPRGGGQEGLRCRGRDGTTRFRSVTLGSRPVDVTIVVFGFKKQKNKIERFYFQDSVLGPVSHADVKCSAHIHNC